jgi:hypothetical protein
VKERARTRAEDTIVLTIVREQDDRGSGHWAVTDGSPKRETRHTFIHRIHRSFGPDNNRSVDDRLNAADILGIK